MISDPLSPSPLRLVVTGSTGRMSASLRALAREDPRYDLLEDMGLRGETPPEKTAPIEALKVDLVIDFTTNQGVASALQIARATGGALLVGTTALSSGNLDAIREFAQNHPVMIAPNTSLGAAVLQHLATEAARMLAGRCDIDITERHHVHKRDAPSGTALRIVDALARVAGVNVSDEHVHSIRAGDIAGEHEVEFACPGERIKIFHSVTDRGVFALGALDAGAWLVTRKPGLHTIDSFLGLDR